MLRRKCNRRNTICSDNFYRLRYRFNCNYVVSGHLCLGFIFLGRSDVHHFYYIGFFTLLLNGSTCKGHLNRTAPDLIVQLMAVFIQQVDVIG